MMTFKNPLNDKGFLRCKILGPGATNDGLGNQLFCVANALAYSRRYEKTAFFPEVLKSPSIFKYKNIFYSNLNLERHVDIYHNIYVEKSFKYDEIPEMKGNIYLEGYFQSEKYFVDNRNYILDSLNIEEMKNKLIEKYGDYSDYISIHVRRGDYLKLKEFHGILGTEYYKNSIQHFGDHQKYIVFSDDIEWCKRNLTFVGNVLYSNCKEDWEDLILMSTCKAHIIANSTFSWWSAWLSGNETIAPQKWFALDDRRLSSKDICPTRWRRM